MNPGRAGDLVGRWVTDPEDAASLEKFGKVSIEFMGHGKLYYAIRNADRQQILCLAYRVEGGVIVTDQSSTPGEDRTPYRFTPEGKLILTYRGVDYSYVRVP